MADQNQRNSAADWAAFLTFDGTVTSTVEFGAFVEVAPGVEGLLHRDHLTADVSVDEHVRVRVLAIDPEARRMSLALV